MTKKSILYFGIITLFFGVLSCKEATPTPEIIQNKEVLNSSFKISFTKVLKNAKAYTLEVAEAMPAEDYTFKISDSVRTFGEQVAHIAISSQFILEKFIKGETPPKSEKKEQEIGISKEETIKLINHSFDDAIMTLNRMDSKALNEKFILDFIPEKPEYTKKEGFLFLRDHITHHRGQAIVSLRAKGLKAPRYRAF